MVYRASNICPSSRYSTHRSQTPPNYPNTHISPRHDGHCFQDTTGLSRWDKCPTQAQAQAQERVQAHLSAAAL